MASEVSPTVLQTTSSPATTSATTSSPTITEAKSLPITSSTTLTTPLMLPSMSSNTTSTTTSQTISSPTTSSPGTSTTVTKSSSTGSLTTSSSVTSSTSNSKIYSSTASQTDSSSATSSPISSSNVPTKTYLEEFCQNLFNMDIKHMSRAEFKEHIAANRPAFNACIAQNCINKCTYNPGNQMSINKQNCMRTCSQNSVKLIKQKIQQTRSKRQLSEDKYKFLLKNCSWHLGDSFLDDDE